MKTKARQGGRRNFLKQLALMGWAGAVATLTGKARVDEMTPVAVPETAVDTSQGYRETTHVRTYYEKASS